MSNFFQSLWFFDLPAVAALGLLGFVAMLSGVSLMYVLAHEKNNGMLTSRKRNIAIILWLAVLFCGIVGVLGRNAFVMWGSLTGIGIAAVMSLGLYERNNRHELMTRCGIFVAFGTLVAGSSVVALAILTQMHGGNGFHFGDIEETRRVVASLPIPWMKGIFVSTVFGFGMLFGLAPLHARRAELLSKIPSPLAAIVAPVSIMIGVLSILRIRMIVDVAVNDGGTWSGAVLMTSGMLTLFCAVWMLWRTQNYKVWFTAIGMFHAALIILFCGIGYAGTIPAVMHLGGIIVLLSLLFVLAAMMHAAYKTTKIPGIRNLFLLLPRSGALLLVTLGVAAMFPLSSFFMSAIIGFGYGVTMHFGLTMITFFLVVSAVTAIVRYALRVIAISAEENILLKPIVWQWSEATIVLGVFFLAVLGWWIGTQPGVEFFVVLTQPIAQL